MSTKRYTSEAQIIEQIDKLKGQVLNLRRDAELEDVLANDHLKQDWLDEHIRKIREHADALRGEAGRLEQKLSQMGEALSEFRTEQLPICKDDGSVPAVGWRKMKV